MKKILATIMALSMMLAVASCDGNSGDTGSTASGGSSAASGSQASGMTSGDTSGGETDDYSWESLSEDNMTSLGIKVTDQDEDGVIRVACLGDSITGGNQGDNWPLYLQNCLTYLGTADGKTYEVKNHGKGGAAVRHYLESGGDWVASLDKDGDGQAYFYYDDPAYTTSLEYTPDVAIVQFGTNDALGGNWDNFDSYFKADYYEYLIKPYLEKGAQVVLATPTYACNGQHDTNVNGKIRDTVIEIAKEYDLPLIDLNKFLEGQNEVFADGLHGNATGYNIMAQKYFTYIFGGELMTATFEVKPGTTIRLKDTDNNISYIKVADDAGKAELSFIPGTYNLTVNLDCSGYKAVNDTITISETGTISFEQVEGGKNVGLDGTGIDCGVSVYGGTNNSAALIDGIRDSIGYQPANWNEGDWCGVELDKAYDVSMLVLYWETATYVSSYADGGYEVYFKSGDNWVKMDDANATTARDSYTGDIVADTIELKTPVNAEGVKIVFKSGKITNHKYAPKLYELEILS